MSNHPEDRVHIIEALSLARKGLGRTWPNPPVGALVVRDGRIVGEGWHRRAGEPHAEVLALEQAGDQARGATIYVTLEPCCHHGRTPPCTDALIVAGVARVVIGCEDPDPRVDCQGAAVLRTAGIEVSLGCYQPQARALISGHACRVEKGRPEVWLKAALSLDGQLAPASGRARWITGACARERVRELRGEVDAILAGAGTVIADDPQLNVRDPAPEDGHQPLRVLLDRRGRIPSGARALGEGALVVTGRGSDANWRSRVTDTGAELVELEAGDDAEAMRETMRRLGEKGLTRVLVEGGSHVHASLLASRVADQALLFYGALFLGQGGFPLFSGPGAVELDAAPHLERLTMERLRDDWLVSGLIRYPDE